MQLHRLHRLKAGLGYFIAYLGFLMPVGIEAMFPQGLVDKIIHETILSTMEKSTGYTRTKAAGFAKRV